MRAGQSLTLVWGEALDQVEAILSAPHPRTTVCCCQPWATRVYSVSHSGSCSSPRFTMKTPQHCMPQEGSPTPTLMHALHPTRLLAILVCFVTPSFVHLLILPPPGPAHSWRLANNGVDFFLGPPQGSVNSTRSQNVWELATRQKQRTVLRGPGKGRDCRRQLAAGTEGEGL